MESTSFTCDCGCKTVVEGWETEGWLTISQNKFVHHKNDEVKLERNFHFKDLNHLSKWLIKVIAVGKRLTRTASELGHRRGALIDTSIPDIHV